MREDDGHSDLPDEPEGKFQRMAGSDPVAGAAALDGLFAAFRASMDPGGRPEVPSRRRPRRDEVVNYRVRVEIAGTRPPVWRGLELASDLFLNEVHDILQAAFGWQDYHLHRFASGSDYYSDETEHYLSPFEADEGESGVPEQEVRLDEVLAEVGERLFYVYDFGDDWEHVLTLQAVLPREEDAPRAVCTEGRRPAPPEDCGGVPGYEFVLAATDPSHPHHAEALAEYRDAYGEVPGPDRAPVPFDIADVNTALAAVSGPLPESLPGPVAELLASVRAPAVRALLRDLVARAVTEESAEPDPATVRGAVRAYAWLLDHVGDDGIKLTGAGYLPPASVEGAAEVLGLEGSWIGKANREVQTLPVLELRESAQRMGLLRKYKGKLLLTPAGRAVREDPRALWDHLAERMPSPSKKEVERVSGLLMLLAVAARSEDVLAEVAEVMTGLGWRIGDGGPVVRLAALDAARGPRSVLTALGGWARAPLGRGDRPTPQGVAFARAALSRWP